MKEARASVFRRVVAWAALTLVACGYRFTAPGGDLPQGIRAVKVPVMQNFTGEPDAEVIFTQALREHALRAGTLGGDEAPAQIEGEVTQVASSPMSTPANGRLTIRLIAAANLRLMKGGVVLSSATVTSNEDVFPGVGTSEQVVASTEASRGAALRRLADVMMKEGYERLCTAWTEQTAAQP